MKLRDGAICNMQVAKLYNDNTEQITNINYSMDGESVITSSRDDQIIIYDCEKGTKQRVLQSKKYGVDLIHFTQNKENAVHASTKENDVIRLMSLVENRYIHYFTGHNRRVVSISMNPCDDTFLSSGHDNSIRLWDVRSNHCQGFMKLGGRPVASFDPEGIIFAAGIGSESVSLYDLRSFDKGPFAKFKADNGDIEEVKWTGLKFSPDGRHILISTNNSIIKLMDSRSGVVLQSFTGHLNSRKSPLEACFTPDSQFVLSGSSDGSIHVWKVETGRKVTVLKGRHVEPVLCVSFNPRMMVMTSACSLVSFWLPTIDSD